MNTPQRSTLSSLLRSLWSSPRWVWVHARSTLVPVVIVLNISACQSPKLTQTSDALRVPGDYQVAGDRYQSADLKPLQMDRAAPTAIEQAWWRALGSRELDALIDRGLAYSPDLRIATLQIVQAKIKADQTYASGAPQITAPFRTAVQAPGGVVGSVPVAGTNGPAQTSYQASLQANWRLDAWGEQAAMNESADLQVARAIHERENAQRLMIANVVSAYASYLTLNDAIYMARKNEALAKDLLQVLARRLAVQDVTVNEYEQQRAAVFVLQALLPGLEQQREDAKNSIAQLLGTTSGTLTLSDAGIDSVSLPVIEVGIPSQLLLNRPDVRMVEARMRSANADINVARARLLPPIDLAIQRGFNALSLAQLLQPQSMFWNALASLTGTIFDGGKKEADKAYAQAYYEEMVENYGRTVYQAIREVESGLSVVRTSNQKVRAQTGAVRAALNIFEVATQAYQIDALDLSALLDARKNYQRQVDDLQHLKGEALRGYISVAQALGAGVALTDTESERQHIIFDIDDSRETISQTGVWGQFRQAAHLDGHRPKANVQNTGWEVQIPGLLHESMLVPLWRDLQYRGASDMDNLKLHAIRQSQLSATSKGTTASIYRLHVAGFSNEVQAVGFCKSLQRNQQSCKVVAPLQSTSVARAEASNQ